MIQRLLKQDWVMPTWSGSIQVRESGKAAERPVGDDADLIVIQVPVKKMQYEQSW